MIFTRVSCVILLAAAFIRQDVQAQTVHFLFTKNTGLYATVAVPVSCAPTLDGVPIAAGDEIGIFTPAGLCVGASVWTGSNIGLNVWPDDPFTPEIDGIQTGEDMKFRLWQKQSKTEFPIVNVTYQSGTGAFASNGLYVIGSLAAFSTPLPLSPQLTGPADAARDTPLQLTLNWQAAQSAVRYRVQLARDSLFVQLADSALGNGLSKDTPKLDPGRTYFWRVRAENSSGVSPWSSVYRFTTVALPAEPALLSPKDGATDVPIAVLLEWQAATGASEYLVHLSADSTFQGLIDPALVAETQKRTPQLAGKTVYYWRVRSGNAAGTSRFSTVFRFTTTTVTDRPDGGDGRIARDFRLEQNFPNPFNPDTQIPFSIPKSVHVKLAVYDVLGREASVLLDEVLGQGWYRVRFTPRTLSSGVYLYRLSAGEFAQTRLMVHTK